MTGGSKSQPDMYNSTSFDTRSVTAMPPQWRLSGPALTLSDSEHLPRDRTWRTSLRRPNPFLFNDPSLATQLGR